MAPLISFLMILILSTLVIRVASVALTLTGISRDIAHFQALSAFTGVGFTTSEAEHIINHPVRRRIITIVIRLGSLGLVTTITSLLLTFVNTSDTSEQITRLVVLAVAISAFGLLAMSSRLDAHLTKVIQLVLSRWTKLNVYDYESMLRLTDGYSVGEMLVRPESWVANQTLTDAGLHHEGIIVLGIYREDGTYIGAPRDQTALRPGDRLIIYGKEKSLRELDKRLAGVEGDNEHQKAVSDQKLL
jgi:K+/H+ antiporter YhaU regulatory subunit KhtT